MSARLGASNLYIIVYLVGRSAEIDALDLSAVHARAWGDDAPRSPLSVHFSPDGLADMI